MTTQDDIYMRLIISERGHVINIPGYPTLRSPCKINVDSMNLAMLVTHLKQIGVSNFVIEENTDLNEPKKKRPILTKAARVVKAIKEDASPEYILANDKTANVEMARMSKQIKDLQSMIKSLMDNSSQQKHIEPKKAVYEQPVHIDSEPSFQKPKKKQVVEELDDEMDFIPEISFDGMEYSPGETEQATIEIDDNLDEELSGLSKLRGKNE